MAECLNVGDTRGEHGVQSQQALEEHALFSHQNISTIFIGIVGVRLKNQPGGFKSIPLHTLNGFSEDLDVDGDTSGKLALVAHEFVNDTQRLFAEMGVDVGKSMVVNFRRNGLGQCDEMIVGKLN